MTGWKTWVGTIIAVASGVVRCGQALLSDPFDPTAFYEGLMMIAGGFGLVGLGHKIEKSSK